jgi:uncharacterized phage protein (TIGR02220 family)
MDARIPILKSRLYPLREHMKAAQIKGYLMRLAEMKPEPLIILYSKSGIPYLQMAKWEKHQQIRAHRSKYPSIVEGESDKKQPLSCAIESHQPPSNVPENPIQSESESESKSESESYIMSGNIYADIICHLNKMAKTDFRHSSQKTRELIKARLNDKFTLQDFITVIDKKTKEWMNTEWQKFLRPETLFSNKFESYLNQPVHISKNQNFNKAVELYNKYEKEEQAQND